MRPCPAEGRLSEGSASQGDGAMWKYAKWPLTIALLVVAVGAGGKVVAAPCLVVRSERDKDAQARVQDTAPPYYFDRCTGLKVTGSEVEACYHNRLGQRQCSTFRAEQYINLPETPPQPKDGALRRLARLLAGQVPGPGGRRLKDDQAIEGFPYGEVLMPRRELAFPVAGAGPEGISSFGLYDRQNPGRPLFQVGIVRDAVRVPAQVLRASGRYTWIADTRSGRVTGSFRTADREEQSEVEREMEGLSSSGARSVMARRLLEAAVYDEHGYFFDRDAALAAAREGARP